MVILALDTSARIGSVALLRDKKLLRQIANSSAEPYSVRLFFDLDQLFCDCGLSLDQTDLFAVAAGPGSFTGLRTGLTAVKAWSELFGKPIAPVSALEAIAVQAVADTTPSGSWIAAVMDARRGQVFGSLYVVTTDGRAADASESDGSAAGVNSLTRVGDELLLSPDEFVDYVLRTVSAQSPVPLPMFASPSPAIIRDHLAHSPLSSSPIEQVSEVLAGAIGLLGLEKARRGETVGALELDANYIRRSDAESKWSDERA